MKTLLKGTALFCLSLMFAFSNVSAQNMLNVPESADLLAVTMIPSVPAPFDLVSVDVQSFMTDLDKATVSWIVNGAEALSGIGEKHFEFAVGDVGSATNLRISIRTNEGETVSKNISVRPGNVDLIWEAHTYTPPFYKGKSLFTPQAEVAVAAVPNIIDERGVRLNSKNLIYKWKIGGKFDQKISGYGKDSITVRGPSVLKPIDIEVEATSVSGGVKSKGYLSLSESVPEIVIYEDNPILGIFYERSVSGQFALVGQEVKLAAIPYFFSTDNKNGGLSYNWSVNGNPALKPSESSIILRNEGGEEGRAAIGLEIKSLDKMFQFARKSVEMTFGNPNNLTPSF